MMSSIYINTARDLEAMLHGIAPLSPQREVAIAESMRDFIVITRYMRDANMVTPNKPFALHFMDPDSFTARAQQRSTAFSTKRGWVLFNEQLLIRREAESPPHLNSDDAAMAVAGLRHTHAVHVFLTATRDADMEARRIAIHHTKFIHHAIIIHALRLGLEATTPQPKSEYRSILLAPALDRFVGTAVETGQFDVRKLDAIFDDMLFKAGDVLFVPTSPQYKTNPNASMLAQEIEELVAFRKLFELPEDALRFQLRQHGDKMNPAGQTYWALASSLPKPLLDLELLAVHFLLNAYKDMKWSQYNKLVLADVIASQKAAAAVTPPLALPPPTSPQGRHTTEPTYGTLRVYSGPNVGAHTGANTAAASPLATSAQRKPGRPIPPYLKLVGPEATPEGE